MTDLALNIRPLHEGQQAALTAALVERVDRLYVLTGRGWGKSIFGAVLAAAIAYGRPRARVTVTYPTFSDAKDIAGDIFQEILPEGGYRFLRGDLVFEIPATRSRILLRTRTSATQSVNAGKRGRGKTNDAVIHDEAAVDVNKVTCHNYNASVRGQRAMGVYYITTPVVGWLKDEVDSFGLGDGRYQIGYAEKTIRDDETGAEKIQRAAVIHGRTISNPYGGEQLHLSMLSELDTRMARQELDGQWVSLSGLLWDNWSWSDWPNGNMHPAGFDERKQWVLSCDFGFARSSWIAWQHHRTLSGGVWVAVAQWQADGEGARQSIARIAASMPGPPAAVYSGHDLNTHSVADGAMTPAYFISQRWGSVPIHGLSGLAMDTRIRYDRTRAMICDANGARKLALSRSCMTHDPTGRGIRHVLEQDSWPPANARTTDYMPKDGKLEHCRDAICHFAASVSPANFARRA